MKNSGGAAKIEGAEEKFLGGKEKMGDVPKKSDKKILENQVKKLELTAKSTKLYIWNVGDGIQKWVNLSTFCSNLTFKNRYITSKNGSIRRLFVSPPLSELAKKLGKMLKYPHFQSAFGTAVCVYIYFPQKQLSRKMKSSLVTHRVRGLYPQVEKFFCVTRI